MALTELTLTLLVVDDAELRADLLGLRRPDRSPNADVRPITDTPWRPEAA